MITTSLIIVCIVLSLICFENRELFYKLCWNPHAVKTQKQYYRIITHGFIHVDLMHLILNMYVLYIFGSSLELMFEFLFQEKGIFYFILLYLGGMVFALPISYKRHQDNYGYNSAGASGAIAALLFSFILINPVQAEIGLLFIPIKIPAFIFGILYLILEYVLDKRANDRVAHDAHFYGAVFGFFFTGLLDPSLFRFFVLEVISFIGF